VLEREITQAALAAGAEAVGFGDVSEGLYPEFGPLIRAVSLGCGLEASGGRVRFPDAAATARLATAARAVAGVLRRARRRFFILPAEPVRQPCYCAALYDRFSHKVAATCAGLGWIGKNGLLVSPQLGPAAVWATVLTDAPLAVGEPMLQGRCGKCDACRRACPARAMRGRQWRRGMQLTDLLDLDACRRHLGRQADRECGRCMAACPYNFAATPRKRTALR
jgi:ferredoxin